MVPYTPNWYHIRQVFIRKKGLFVTFLYLSFFVLIAPISLELFSEINEDEEVNEDVVLLEWWNGGMVLF